MRHQVPPFEYSILGGLTGDPAVSVQIKKSGRHLLFDIGDISALTKKQMVRTNHIFVTHTHMDHFMDFDRLVRAKVSIKKTIFVYGPPGIIDQLSHKLLAYTWNLIDQDQLCFHVTEIDSNKQSLIKAIVSRRSGFLPTETKKEAMVDAIITTFDDQTIIRGVNLNHKGIDSIAYQLEYPGGSKVDVKAIHTLALKPGPWLSELQTLNAKGNFSEKIKIGDMEFEAGELSKKVLKTIDPYRLTYVTDIGFEDDNIHTLLNSLKPTDTLICESSFSSLDADRAIDKAHLTSYHAACIARGLGTQDFKVFHISNIYGDQADQVAHEAMETFNKFREVSDETYRLELRKELERCQNK